MKQSIILLVAKSKTSCYSVIMAPMQRAHFESNRTPETASAVMGAPAADSYVNYSFYYYAYQAMLEVRSSGD